MTNQQKADELLAYWQKQRRTNQCQSGDIGHMTFGIWANTKDVYDAWMGGRKGEFGKREIDDLSEALLALTVLLAEINKQKVA